jgi:hypothetical protein
MDAAIAHHGVKTFALDCFAGWMLIKQADLVNDCRSHETGQRRDLGADFKAQAAGNAAGKRIHFLLRLRRNPRPCPQVIRAVDRYPGSLTRLRFSKSTLRSTARSRMTGKRDRGSKRTGCSSLFINDEHGIAAFPLISMAHDPQPPRCNWIRK